MNHLNRRLSLVSTFALAACASHGSTTSSGSGGTTASATASSSSVSSSSSGTGGAGGGASICMGAGATGFNQYKYAYFGDLHLHTSYSLDAYSFGTRSTPTNAYLFAKGKATVHVSEGVDTLPGPIITQPRPIDFLAITDHSEWLLVTHGCTVDMNSGYYNSNDCGLVRSTKAVDQTAVFADMGGLRKAECAANPTACAAQEQSAWADLIGAANTAYQPCQFTSLVAYEWTDSKQVVDMQTNMAAGATNHRNVIFANDHVPKAPLDSATYTDPPALWNALDAQCTAADGCDVVTIPHNTNLSGGVSLVLWDPSPKGIAQQEHYQVAAEIYQHKGSSECYYSPADGYKDPDCQFEYVATNKAVNRQPLSFVREGMGSGLGYAAANPGKGNPLKLGIVGATDDHNGAPGNVDDATYVGHAGRGDDYPVKRLTGSPEFGSGALTGAWAEENTRDAIFGAIKRRETFATSGPRITVRFYATKDAASACSDSAFPKNIVDGGAVPMGGTFGPQLFASGAPTFALTVWPDAVPQKLGDDTTAVAGLARVQIIKVHAKAVAGGAPTVVEDPPYPVSGIPAMGGCATWKDPSFDPTEYSLYYVRAIQVPTWRWSHWSCITLKQNNPNTWQTLVPDCAPGGSLDVAIDERAWTSPIYFEP